VAKTKNISPDNYQNYMIELMIANQKKILKELDRINERFDRIEAYVGMSDREKNKPANFYNTEEVMEMLHVSRNTLLSYRKNGILSFTKPGKNVLYTMEDINKIREYKKKTA
jgi:hypothetical protein